MKTDTQLLVDEHDHALEAASTDIRIENFSGPLDLLLYLIRKDELDIRDIPIARITRQYLDYLEVLRSLDLEVAGEYILMAATLIRIKAQMLLPRPAEELEEEDPRRMLVAALLEYQQFKEASGMLHGLESDMRRRFASPGGRAEGRVEETFPADVSVYDLVSALGEMLKRSKVEIVHQVFAEPYHMEDQMEVIRTRLLSADLFLLSDLVGRRPVRGLLVATFLALLELTRLHLISIEQTARYRDIVIRRPLAAGSIPVGESNDSN
jgi:segregation and condensation protein A